MRFVTCLVDGGERAGLVDGDDIRLFGSGVALIDLLGDLAGAAARVSSERVPLAGAHLLAPVPRPPTVRDFYAFEQHVATARRARGLEMEPDWYELPVFYFSNPYATIGPTDTVTAPPGCTELDYELEVAAIIGRSGADLSPAEAEAHIAGYCIMHDWSARDLQRREMKLSLGPAKGKDFATSLGPFLVTPDELERHRKGKSFHLTMNVAVNGREYSRANLADIHWSFGEMVAYASRGTRVERGDVIGSGTCGTGCILELSLVHGHDAYPWLRPGDRVEAAVEGLGCLQTGVV
jgi:2-keto-4-pentenoate hydratase/2-oxohepta-3-ene-1,7-dioic acid hydratase in catechol pathway